MNEKESPSLDEDEIFMIQDDRILPVQVDRIIIASYIKNIKPLGFAVYCVLLEAQSNLFPELSVRDIADMLGVSRPTAQAGLRILESAGLITIHTNKRGQVNYANTYQIHHVNPSGSTSRLPTKKSLVPPTKESLHITTTTNSKESEKQNALKAKEILKATYQSNATLWSDKVNLLNFPKVGRMWVLDERFGEAMVFEAIYHILETKTAQELPYLSLSYLETILSRWAKEGRDAPRADRASGDYDPLGEYAYE